MLVKQFNIFSFVVSILEVGGLFSFTISELDEVLFYEVGGTELEDCIAFAKRTASELF